MRKVAVGWFLVCLSTLFSACIEKEYITIAPEEEPQDQSSYTVMMYGCGGGNLDRSMVLNIQEALLAGSSERVKFTGQVKFSDRFQQTEVLSGTQRFIVGSTPERWYTPVEVLDTELPLYDPENLADFIRWSKEQCPADEYILMLWNHGGAWLPEDDVPSHRAIIYDDVLDKEGLTLEDLVAGVKASDTHLKMIYFDACLMGMAEVLVGVSECADYALGASHVTPGLGGDYNSLLYHLKHSTNFEQAMAAYCRETVSHWSVSDMPLDLKLVDLREMDHLLSEIKVFAGYLEEAARVSVEYLAAHDGQLLLEDSDEFMIAYSLFRAVDSCYHYDSDVDKNGYAAYPYYDLLSLAEVLANKMVHSYTARYVDIASRLNRAFSKTIVCQEVTSLLNGKPVTMGVSIVDATVWRDYKYDTAYPTLAFEKKTNWGKWLSINPFTPVNNPNPNTLVMDDSGDEEGEEGDDEEIPDEETPGEDTPEDGADEEGSEDRLAAEIAMLLELIGKQ